MIKANFINKSFKDKLRATYTSFMLVVLILLSAFLYFQMNVTVKPIIDEVGKHTVDSEARYLGERFDDQGKMLGLLASTETFKNGNVFAIKKDIDTQMRNQQGLLLSLKYVTLDGKEYDNNPDNINVSTNYEKQILSGNMSQIIQTTFNSKLGEYIATIGTRIIGDDGKIKGMLISNVSVNKLTETLNKTDIGKLIGMWIFDSKGNPVMRPDKNRKPVYDIEGVKRQFKSKPGGEISMKASDDRSNYLICSQIPNTQNLYLAMGLDHGNFSKAMIYILYTILGCAIFICFVIFVAAHKMTNFVTKPLTRMVEIIERSDGINFIEMPNYLKNSRDEIGVLANTIDKMAVNIRNNVQALNWQIKERQKAEEYLIVLNDGLECRVDERTRELTMATNNLSISEDRFRIAMEASHIGLYDSDCKNNVLVVNGVFLKLINAQEFKCETIKESDWIEFNGKIVDYVHEEDLIKFSCFGEDNVPMVGEDFYSEFRLKEDPNIWLAFIGKIIKKDESGKVIRFIGVLQNITERKRTEVELKAAKDEADEASMAKSQFLANMSHEIRTPMNAIMGLTHLISQSNLNEVQKNYVSKIEGSSTTLLRIINDILDFSKIEAGKLEIENIKFNLDKVLENVSNLYTVSATNKGIDINFDKVEDVPDVLIGDPLRVEQIISNLTTNAIKFTNQGEVKVTVRIADETQNKIKLLFSVSDTGIGLTKEHINKLFTPFTQADGSMTRKYGGTGLGLTISKQLVELMNGEIWVDSEYSQGANFKFTVEFDKAVDIIKPSYEGYPDLRGKKVLVVDHNKTSLMILERMLKSFSFEVSAIRDPFKAIELLKNESFDLLVLDFNLPELPGIDLYKRLIANTEIKVPKTIFVSATGRESYYNQIKQLGVKNFLVKPINQSLMFDAVMDALKGATTKEINRDYSEESQAKYQRVLLNKKILLVEDNDINQLVAKDILEQAGIKVNIANNGEEAIKHIHGNVFDAVLMDVQMPVMDGYKATEIIRKTYSSYELPIIAMTANALTGDRERSISAGMNDYISKPINPEILFETLIKWILGKEVKIPETPIIDTKEVISKVLDSENTIIRLGNKQDFYYDLLKKYLSNYSDAIKVLSDMIGNNQSEEAKRFIHSLKGVTGNIGGMKLHEFIIEFEGQYESYDEEHLTEKLQRFSNLNEELINAIKEVIPTDNSEEILLSKDFDINKALNNLFEALQKARAKEIKENMNYLVANIKNTPYELKINDIKKLVDRYRFKDAKAMVDELMHIVKES